MYVVKGFTVSEARARFGDLLDQAEQGEAVVIERRGVRFTLRSEAAPTAPPMRPFFDWIDPAVESGQWTWALTRSGAKFQGKRRRTR